MDEMDVAQVDMADVPVTFGDDEVLLDVRELDEWQRGHIDGAQHIPMGEVPARLAEIDADATL
ncbi:rhodanese-like domain-containing protein, partial [Micromonospora sp. WMMD736]|uniref:rhodanese-like domain-containing protein n=1 Tax=Micromonospora sp. WMMD736 TaxID=3404112 RepID=UPI003B931E67